MPSRFDAYRMTDGKTPLSARYFNPVLQDLDLRLVELEALRVGWLEAVSQVSNLGLARINELVGAPMNTVNEAIATLQQSLAALPDVVLAGELDTALQAEAQARAQLAQQIAALQDAIEDVGGGDPFPPMEGSAGKFLTTDGETRSWGMPTVPAVTGLQRGTAQQRQLLGISADGAVVGMAPLELLDYTERAQLRTLTAGNAIVRGLGLFTWEAGSTEPDDDETCFAAAGGAWVLTAAGPDAVRALWLAEVSAMQETLTKHMARFLNADFAMSATSLAGNAEVTFTVALDDVRSGDSVVVTPVAGLPIETSCTGVVTAAGTVTVSVRNHSASTVTLTPGTWQVLVIKP
ncbi:hypothetical protein QF021_000276 [Acidovorax delafieldii]|uniref:hypothetical protein n=1 Tax=Acidovorax delafieldii TaxID=47920 RepID=UPI0028598A3D|nr:hypothetical protein [Acidovorax delafieldii]MDR6152187.1 hypothetical protein [Acidovorax delafieldii]